MKILAIRGSNLTSLAGDFSVEFGAGLLERAGVFAITGPTGAGKTTLLDAMCVALFAQTPRVSGAGSSNIAPDAQYDLTDSRSLLRRGATTGFAEVDFTGVSGERYRVRWTARRARGKADGNLQESKHVLYDAAGVPLTDGTKQTVETVTARLGLSFDQFKRSVLLAQGDFAAFLKAQAEPRTALLEKMTGTGIYRAISIECHAREVTARTALAAFDTKISGQLPMESSARETIEQQHAATVVQLETSQTSLDRLETIERWYADSTRLTGAVAEAQDNENALVATARGLDADRARLRERERIEHSGIDAVWHALGNATTSVESARVKRENAATAYDAATTREAVARAALDSAQRALDEATQARTAIEPVLARADGLTRERDRLRSDLEKSGRDEATANSAHATALREEEKLRGEEAAIAAGLADTTAWLAANAPVGALASAWTFVAPMLHARLAAAGELASATRMLTEARRDRDASAVGASAVERERAEREDVWKVAFDEAAAIAKRLVEPETVRLATISSAAAQRMRDDVKSWRDRVDARDEAEHAHDDARAAITQYERTQGELGAQIASGLVDLRAAEDGVVLTRGRHDGIVAMLGLDEHRARLKDGDACPLCGSVDHPLVRDGAPQLAALDAAKRAMDEAERARRALDDSLARHREKLIATHEDLAAATVRWTAANARLGAIDAEWTAAVDPPGAPGDRSVTAVLDTRDRDAIATLARADEIVRAMLAVQQEHDVAAKREAACRADRDRVATHAQTSREAAAAAAGRVALTEEAYGRSSAEYARLVTETRRWLEPFGAIESRIDAGDVTAVRQLDALVATFTDHESRMQTATVASKHLSDARALVSITIDERSKVLAGVRSERSRIEHELAACSAALAELVGDRAWTDVRDEHEAAQSAAVALQHEAALALAHTASQREGARSDHEARTVEHEDAVRVFEDIRSRYVSALETHGWNENDVAGAMAWSAADVQRTREAVNEADAALRSARDACEAAVRSLTDHASRAPEVERAVVGDEVVATRARVKELTGTVAILARQLADDDVRRANVEGYAAERAALAAVAARWKEMDELIGATDGKKFAAYAQTLTLERLLAHANEHLRDLCRRYRLAPTGTDTLDFHVIDQDMGDERRAVSSLSGGESFLVSLALALALSSLASGRLTIGSLFIDEGFGTLDLATLETAIAALDALQATGRQVGVISHVRELEGRITAQVRVIRTGAGSSRVEVTAG